MHSRGVSALMMINLISLESKDGGIIASVQWIFVNLVRDYGA
jgi:hypothetical protein